MLPATRAIGELADPAQIRPALFGGRLDDAKPTGIGHRGGESRPGDLRHGCADDGNLDARELAKAIAHDCPANRGSNARTLR
jgi:hypothetical protein